MKKINPSYLLFFAGILWLFAGIISEGMRWGYALGFAFIALGIAIRIKDPSKEDIEQDEFAMTDEEIKQGELLADQGGELLTDEEEKQVWEEFQGKVEEDESNY